MPRSNSNRRLQISKRYQSCGVNGRLYVTTEVATLSDFFAVFHSLLEPNKDFWFRGHPKIEYTLAPSALRYSDAASRERALNLVADVQRYLEIKLPRPPQTTDRLGWMQVAQHYGLPTRLLDWTQNAAIALYFASSEDMDKDGLVVVLNPLDLNQWVDPKSPRIFDIQRDREIIEPYFKLNGKIRSGGKHSIAINPTWNNERIAIQQGVFTLHGARKFELDRDQASSLIMVPVLKEHKASLHSELERVGVGEMFIFPEPEHVCSHLKRAANL